MITIIIAIFPTDIIINTIIIVAIDIITISVFNSLMVRWSRRMRRLRKWRNGGRGITMENCSINKLFITLKLEFQTTTRIFEVGGGCGLAIHRLGSLISISLYWAMKEDIGGALLVAEQPFQTILRPLGVIMFTRHYVARGPTLPRISFNSRHVYKYKRGFETAQFSQLPREWSLSFYETIVVLGS